MAESQKMWLSHFVYQTKTVGALPDEKFLRSFFQKAAEGFGGEQPPYIVQKRPKG